MKTHPLVQMMQRRKEGVPCGIPSYCSANKFVLEAALRRAKETGDPVLIEATANQVNQFGGYTGMKPKDFYSLVRQMAADAGLPEEQLILGGDHLGPLTWQHLPEAEAMELAKALVYEYARAGFTKIHLDTSMKLHCDPEGPLSVHTVARRGAVLYREAMRGYSDLLEENPQAVRPVFVIGSEVPIPGGAQENEDAVAVTRPEDCEAALAEFKRAFDAQNLTGAWERVVALVVQPGVEFADESVVEYDRDAAKALATWLKTHPNLVFEGHSTDYQPKERLRQMAEDGIAILKVGPALTFALREGLFALERIEQELYTVRDFPLSHFRAALEQAMLEDESQWRKYYHGSTAQKRYARAFSYSDRARYYLTSEKVKAATSALLANLDAAGIPMALLSQYLPSQYAKAHEGRLSLRAQDLLIDRVGDCIDDYLYAVLRKEHMAEQNAANTVRAQ